MSIDQSVLPDGNGLSLIHELRGNEKTKDLPIIVVSGSAEEGQKNSMAKR